MILNIWLHYSKCTCKLVNKVMHNANKFVKN